MTRKLIKPNLIDAKKSLKNDTKKKAPPPFRTHAETYYYVKQMNNKTLLELELIDGTTIRGTIEWYDEKCLKIRKDTDENVILFKHFIKLIRKGP
jgi:sRNA-binding regulator protein Hfq